MAEVLECLSMSVVHAFVVAACHEKINKMKLFSSFLSLKCALDRALHFELEMFSRRKMYGPNGAMILGKS